MKVPAHLLLFLFATLLAAGANASSTLPNIVIFMSDDMGWNDVGYHGGS